MLIAINPAVKQCVGNQGVPHRRKSAASRMLAKQCWAAIIAGVVRRRPSDDVRRRSPFFDAAGIVTPLPSLACRGRDCSAWYSQAADTRAWLLL